MSDVDVIEPSALSESQNGEAIRQLPPLPNSNDVEALRSLYLSLNPAQRGYKTFSGLLETYFERHRLLVSGWEDIERSYTVLAGHRTPAQLQSYQKRTSKTVAQRFYESLTPAQLEMHCSVFGINRNTFETREACIQALAAQTTQVVVA